MLGIDQRISGRRNSPFLLCKNPLRFKDKLTELITFSISLFMLLDSPSTFCLVQIHFAFQGTPPQPASYMKLSTGLKFLIAVSQGLFMSTHNPVSEDQIPSPVLVPRKQLNWFLLLSLLPGSWWLASVFFVVFFFFLQGKCYFHGCIFQWKLRLPMQH